MIRRCKRWAITLFLLIVNYYACYTFQLRLNLKGSILACVQSCPYIFMHFGNSSIEGTYFGFKAKSLISHKMKSVFIVCSLLHLLLRCWFQYLSNYLTLNILGSHFTNRCSRFSSFPIYHNCYCVPKNDFCNLPFYWCVYANKSYSSNCGCTVTVFCTCLHIYIILVTIILLVCVDK